jgi:hypothetical protein
MVIGTIIGDGIITVVNRIGITGTITPLNSSNNNNHSNRIITITRSIIFRQIILNQK